MRLNDAYADIEPVGRCVMPIAAAKAGPSAHESVGSSSGGTLLDASWPQSTMGKAIHYALDQWESLEVYLQDPLIEIDNNLVENAIRPTALGKKNWLFFGDAKAGERSAVIYSIIESCRRHGVEPYTYLCDVLRRLPSMTNWQIKDITPKAWARSRKELTQKAA